MIGYPAECIRFLQEADPEKRWEVREERRRRSLTQNAYYWAMLSKLAAALGMPAGEVHMHMLREYGVCDVFSLALFVSPNDYWDYWEELGIDRGGETARRVVKAYKGSSRMTSAEFSRLINGMREECEAQGIDVMTPAELAALRFEPGL